jgi:hypothetical protein
MYRFQNFGFFRGFPRFLEDSKNSQNADFSVVSWDFEGWARPKILCGFPAMNRAQNLYLPAVSRNFWGTQKILKMRFFPAVSWDFKGRVRPKFSRARTSPQFSWDFEGSDPPQKISEPTSLSTVFLRL